MKTLLSSLKNYITRDSNDAMTAEDWCYQYGNDNKACVDHKGGVLVYDDFIIGEDTPLVDGHLPALEFHFADDDEYPTVIINTTKFKSFENFPKADAVRLVIKKSSIKSFDTLTGINRLYLEIYDKSLKTIDTDILIGGLKVSGKCSSIIPNLEGLMFDTYNGAEVLRIEFDSAKSKDIHKFFVCNRFYYPVSFTCFSPTRDVDYLININAEIDSVQFLPEPDAAKTGDLYRYDALFDLKLNKTLRRIGILYTNSSYKKFVDNLEAKMHEINPEVIVDMN